MSRVHEVVEVVNGKIVHKWEKISGGEGGGGTTEDVVLDSDMTFTAAVGGVDANTTFKEGTTLDALLRSIASKMILPTVTLKSNLSTLVYELGTKVYGGVTLTATVTKGSSNIAKVEFFKQNKSVSVITSDVSAGGNFKYADGVQLSADTDYKVSVTNVEGKTVSASLGIRFYNPYYYGVSSKKLDELTSSDIESLTKDVSAKGTKKYKYTANNLYCIMAYPKSYGLLKSILDANNFQNIDSMSYTEVDVKGVTYYVYQTNSPVTCTNFEYTFSY